MKSRAKTVFPSHIIAIWYFLLGVHMQDDERNWFTLLLLVCFCIVTTLYLSADRCLPSETSSGRTLDGDYPSNMHRKSKQRRTPLDVDHKSYQYYKQEQTGANSDNLFKENNVILSEISQDTGNTFDSSIPDYQPSKMPFIFVGGMPRSGTTLMRAMLDSHGSVRCGEETRILPRILGMRNQWFRSEKEKKRLKEAGINDVVLNSAIGAFITEVIVRHGKPSERYCNKDPFMLKSAEYVNTLFPQAKFLLMIRDGRATVHSIITRKVTITGFDLNNPRQCLQKWNAALTTMYDQCQRLGPDICFPVYYEQLVLQPEKWMREILKFLDLPWETNVLHHEQFVGGKISVSNVERSTDQIIKPINTESLSKWVGFYPEDVLNDMDEIAPMLKQLGYDPEANPPKYGEPDQMVLQNNQLIERQKDKYEEKAANLMGDQQAELALKRQDLHDKGLKWDYFVETTTKGQRRQAKRRRPVASKMDDAFVDPAPANN